MNDLIQLISNQNRPFNIQIYFRCGKSTTLQDVKVTSNHTLIGTNQFQGKTFIPLKNVMGYCILPEFIKKDRQNIIEENQKGTNNVGREITSRNETANRNYTDIKKNRESEHTLKKEIASSIGKPSIIQELLNSKSHPKNTSLSYSKAKQIPPLNQLDTLNFAQKKPNIVQNRSSNLTLVKVTEKEESKNSKIIVTSINGNSKIKISGTFTNYV